VSLSRPFRSRDQDRFFGLLSDRSCPMTDGLRPHSKVQTRFHFILQSLRDLAIRSRDRDLDKMNSSLEAMVSRSQH